MELKGFVEGLHHVGIPTCDMAGTVRFYTDLGGEIIFEKDDVDEGRPIQVKLFRFHGMLIECYERATTAGVAGAVDHLAFQVHDIERMYALCKEKGYRLMEDCAEQIGYSTYWPRGAQWFIVYGPNGEKIEFCRECE